MYFTGSNIDEVSASVLERISLITGLRPLPEKTGKPALIVIDMQDFFLDAVSHAFVPSAEAVIQRIAGLVNAYKAAGCPVIYTRHTNTPDNAQMMKKWWRDILSSDNPLYGITERLDTSDCVILEKSQYDAFIGTNLEQHLTDNGISFVAVTGVMTNLCCETTARAAFTRGFEVAVPVDATAAYNLQFHFSSLLNLSYGYSYVPLSRELIKRIS